MVGSVAVRPELTPEQVARAAQALWTWLGGHGPLVDQPGISRETFLTGARRILEAAGS